MIVQFSEGFLKSLREYGTNIRITTALIEGNYRKFESLWSDETQTSTFTIHGEGKGPVIVYYSDYNDNIVGEAFTLGTYTPESAPLGKEVYIKGEVVGSDGNLFLGSFPYFGDEGGNNLYLATKSLDEDEKPIIKGQNVSGRNNEDLILTETNYFNVTFPGEINANILETYSSSDTIKFLEDPYQIEGCNIFICDDGVPTRESYEKHYRRQILSKNIIPSYLDSRGEKVFSSTVYKDYKEIFIQTLDAPSSGSTYYVGNSKTVTVTGYCIFDEYKVENGVYTLAKKDCIEGIDTAILEGISGSGYLLDRNTITFSINSTTEKSSFQAYIRFKDEMNGGNIKEIKSNTITFIAYLGWSAEYSSNLKEDDGNIVFLFDSNVGSTGLLQPSRISIYTDADVPVESVVVEGESEYFNFDIKKDEDEISEQYKYTVDISTKQSIGENGDWFPIDDTGSSALSLYTLTIEGSSDQIHFYCVQRAKYPLRAKFDYDNLFQGDFGAKELKNVEIVGKPIPGYSSWDYELTDDQTSIELTSGKSIGSSFNIITSKNPGEKISIKFYRVGPTGEVIDTNWKDVMYCYDSCYTLELDVSGENSSSTSYFYKDSLLFLFKEGITVHSINGIPEDGEFKNPVSRYFDITWKNDTLTIEAKGDNESEWYPRTESREPIEIKYGNTKFYCVMVPNFSETISITDKDTGELVDRVVFSKDKKEVNLVIKSTPENDDFDYWVVKSLDSRISVFYNNYLAGMGVPFKKNIITLTTDYESPDSRDLDFEPLVIKRIPSRYNTLLDYYSDWKTQLVDGITTFSLPISIVGQPPSESLEVSVFDPDGTSRKINDDDVLELSYIGLYKILVKSGSVYRISIKGVTKGEQYLYFFNNLTSDKRDNVLSIDKGTANVTTGAETTFVFYGNEPGAFTTSEQILATYIQVEDIQTGETINIRLKRKYPDNNLKMVSPSGSDIIIRDEDVNIIFLSNVETNFGEPSFNNVSFSQKGEVIRNTNTTEIWTRGYLQHSYMIDSSNMRPQSLFPVRELSTLKIENPNNYNDESLTYSLIKLAPSPTIESNKASIRIPYFGNGTDSIIVTPRKDSNYRVYFRPNSGERVLLWESLSDGFPYYNYNGISICKEFTTDTWIVSDMLGQDYEDEESLNIGDLIFVPYIDKNNFIEGREFDQTTVDGYVPGIEKVIPIYRLCREETVSTIEGSKELISRLGGTRTYDARLVTDSPVDVNTPLREGLGDFINSMNYESKVLSVQFKSRIAGYSPVICNWSNAGSVVGYTKSRNSDFYIYEGEKKVEFTGLEQVGWTRGIRYNYGTHYGNLYLGEENELNNFYLSYNTNEYNIWVSSINLPTSIEGSFEDELAKKCNITFEGPGNCSCEVGNQNLTPFQFGYNVTLKTPQNDGVDQIGPFVLTISDDYGNKVVQRFYKNANNIFNVLLVDEDHIDSDGNVIEFVSETSFSANGDSLHPSPMYILTNAPSGYNKTFSLLENNFNPSIGYNQQLFHDIGVSSTPTKAVYYNGISFGAYKVNSISSRFNKYYSNSFSQYNGYGHTCFKTDLSVVLNCNGGNSYSNKIIANHGYCSVKLTGPFKTEMTPKCYVDFSQEESIDKYFDAGSFLVSNVRPSLNNDFSCYYELDNTVYINYAENDPVKYRDNFQTNGYYAGFGLEVDRKEVIYVEGEWKTLTLTSHTIESLDSLLRTSNNDEDRMEISEGLFIPRYWCGDDSINIGDCSHSPGTTTTDGSTYLPGFLFQIPASSFLSVGTMYSCDKFFTLSTKGIKGSLTFKISFTINL